MRAVQKVVQNSLYNSKTTQFTARHRLLRQEGFDHVVKAKNISDKCFRVFFERNTQKNARLGIIASKKMLPRAVDRNRVKRLVREAFRQHSIKEINLDMVVMVRHAYVQQVDAQSNNLEKLFSRICNQCAES